MRPALNYFSSFYFSDFCEHHTASICFYCVFAYAPESLYFPVQLLFASKNVFFSTLLSNKFNKNEVGLPVVSASGKFVWYPDLPVLSCYRSDMMNLCDSICLVYGVLK